MPTIYNCDPSELIEKTAEELKKIEAVKPPVWAPFVKTGMHKERPPVKNDWWYVRAASVLRQIYRYGPIGTSKLRTMYGGKKNRGYKPEHFYKGSGSIIRKVMQQLEKEGFVKTDIKSMHKGRIITAKGKRFLDAIAGKISKSAAEKAPEQKAEAKEKPADNKESKQEKKIEEAKQEQKEKHIAEAKAAKEDKSKKEAPKK